MKYIIGFILFIAATIIGTIFPDFDLKFTVPGIIVHRSVLTHSILLPLIWYSFSYRKNVINNFFTLGLFLGIGIHLSFDLFPAAFAGGALIHIPFLGRFGFFSAEISVIVAMIFTIIWIFSNIYLSFKYYFKIAFNKTWISIMIISAIPVSLYSYSSYFGENILFPSLLIGGVILLMFKKVDIKL